MDLLKVMLVISLGLGVTWAADQVAPSAIVVAQADGGEVSDADVDRQLEKARQSLEGEDDEELKDFVPSEPLSADIAVEFPSDI